MHVPASPLAFPGIFSSPFSPVALPDFPKFIATSWSWKTTSSEGGIRRPPEEPKPVSILPNFHTGGLAHHLVCHTQRSKVYRDSNLCDRRKYHVFFEGAIFRTTRPANRRSNTLVRSFKLSDCYLPAASSSFLKPACASMRNRFSSSWNLILRDRLHDMSSKYHDG